MMVLSYMTEGGTYRKRYLAGIKTTVTGTFLFTIAVNI
jgi:hypothetical protein